MQESPRRKPRKLFDWKGDARYSWKAGWPIEYPGPGDEPPCYLDYI